MRAILAAILALSAGPFDPGWDGLSGLRAALEARAPRVRVDGDLEGLAGDAALLIIGGVDLERPRPILSAIQAGARLVMLVESDGPLLSALGLSVLPAPGSASPQHPALYPVWLEPHGAALLGARGPLLANHAVALSGLEHTTPSARLDEGGAFAHHLKLGRGEILVLGDSSLFIDLMLGHAANRAALAGLAGWLTEGGTRPLYVLTSDVTPRLPAPPHQDRLARLNDWLRRLTRPPPEAAARIFIALLTLPLLLTGLLYFRARGGPRPPRVSAAASRGPQPTDGEE